MYWSLAVMSILMMSSGVDWQDKQTSMSVEFFALRSVNETLSGSSSFVWPMNDSLVYKSATNESTIRDFNELSTFAHLFTLMPGMNVVMKSNCGCVLFAGTSL